MKEYDIAVIGGGPAGIMAAIAASQNSSSVVLLEKNSSLGRKLLITGGGRCNITNAKPIRELLNSYSSKNFLKHSFYSFTNEDLLSLFDLEFITEEDNRVFPKSGKSSDILKGLTDKLDGVSITYNFEVKTITKDFVINDKLKAHKIIIATGGVTYPQTGCGIESYKLTSQPLTDIKYGLTPLLSEKDLSDINLSNEISESISYNLLENDQNIDLEIAIDLIPEISRDELHSKFNADFQDKGKTKLKNYLKLFLSNRFVDYFLDEINIDKDIKLSQINKKSKNRLVENLKRFSFKIIGFNSDLSKITIGGVDLDYVDSKTMQSTVIPNLYFAGEVLDLHGPTGGYNLKIAFSTGYLAGISASEDFK